MKLSCFIFLLPVALIGQRLLLPECGNRTMQTHPHFSWEQDICTLPTAMPETEIQIASDADFRLLVDTDSVASVIQRYVPAKPLCPGNYFWRVRHVLPGQAPRPWTQPSNFEIYQPSATFSVPLGSTPDQIQEVVDNASKAAPARIVFERGNWDVFLLDALLYLEDCRDLIIDGNGSTFGVRGHGSFVKLRDCKDIHIQGFSIEYLDYAHIAAKIVAKDIENYIVDLKLLPGYPTLESEPILADYPGVTLRSSHTSGLKTRTVWQARTKLGFENLGDRTYRYEVEEADIDAFEIGDTYFKGPKWGSGFFLDKCNHITLSEITVYRCQSVVLESRSSNWLRIFDLDVKQKPGRPLATNVRSQDHLNSIIAPWVENCVVENAVRDVCRISGRGFPVRQVLTPNKLRIGAFPNAKPGEKLLFFDKQKGEVIHRCKVTEVEQLSPEEMVVTLDKAPGHVRTGEGWSNTTTATLVFNLDRQGNQFVWRGNQCREIQMKGLVCTGNGGLVENNKFIQVGHGAIEMIPTNDAGISAFDYVIRKNQFIECGFANRWVPNGSIQIYNLYGSSPLHGNILITGNEFRGYRNRGILVRSVADVVIQKNRISNNKFTQFPKTPGVIEVGNSATNVTLEDNSIEEIRALPDGAVIYKNAG